jgi:hypothetical protein
MPQNPIYKGGHNVMVEDTWSVEINRKLDVFKPSNKTSQGFNTDIVYDSVAEGPTLERGVSTFFFLPRCSHTWELAPAFGA